MARQNSTGANNERCVLLHAVHEKYWLHRLFAKSLISGSAIRMTCSDRLLNYENVIKEKK